MYSDINDDKKGSKKGFARIGFVDNFKTYLSKLSDLSGKDCSFSSENHRILENYIDTQLRDKKYLYLNDEFEPLDFSNKEQEINAKNNSTYILVNTGFTMTDTNLPIWGGFVYSNQKNCFKGVELNIYDSLIEKWKNKSVSLDDFTYVNDYEPVTRLLNSKTLKTYHKEQWKPLLSQEFDNAFKENRIGIYKKRNKGLAYFKLNLLDKNDNDIWLKMDLNTNEKVEHEWFGLFLVSRENLEEEIYKISNYCLGSMVFEINKNFDGIQILLEDLAKTAMKESWDLKDHSKRKFSVLRSYLENTLIRLELEDKRTECNEDKKIIRKDTLVFFNTGLLSKHLDDIFIVGEDSIIEIEADLLGKLKYSVIKNPKTCIQTDSYIKEHLVKRNLPKMAQYFTDDEMLNFNPNLNPSYNAEHICKDNLERILPANIYENIKNNSAAKEDWINKLYRHFESAVKQSFQLASRSFRLAVPQFNPETEKIQFLLPICLKFTNDDNVTISDDYNQPCCVLVLANEGEGSDEHYDGKTILTLDMAYNNARLIERPGITWLDKITE